MVKNEIKEANGFRKGKRQEALDSLRSSLTEEELSRIEGTRKLDNVPKGTLSYKLALHEDPLRKSLRETKYNLKKIIWNVRNTNNQLFRAQLQLDNNKITEQVPETNIVMSEEELKTWMMHMKWIQEGQINTVPSLLLKIRAAVGHYDYERKLVITEEEFNKYVTEIQKEIKELGFDLFE